MKPMMPTDKEDFLGMIRSGEQREEVYRRVLADAKAAAEVFTENDRFGCLSGPTGLNGLAVRLWTCAACGSHHDRDINAAINTLTVGLGMSLERQATVSPKSLTTKAREVHQQPTR